MAKVLVIYASLTGSTELMAEAIHDHVKAKGHDVEQRSFDFEPLDDVQDLLNYDAIMIGSYSWDDDIPFEIDDFYEDMDEVDLTGKPVGVFGSCDSFYPLYGAALETMAKKSIERGATLYEEKLKFELEPDDEDIKAGQAFADGILDLVK